MPETSRSPSERSSESELPRGEEEKGGEVLPIRPDAAIPSRERSGLSEAEAKRIMDEIKEVNSMMFSLRRDKDALKEGLDEDMEEAGRQILRHTWLSRMKGWFLGKKGSPIQYDADTRREVSETAMDMSADIERLRARRGILAERLDPAAREKLEADWRELDRIYDEISRDEKGE